jgi:hypothetical protein
MRQHRKAGERGFVDYSGKQPSIVDPATGEVIDVECVFRADSIARFG